MADVTYVVVGGGLAGAKAVEAVRAGDTSGRVVLVSTETEPPYERPPLSKEYLKGDKTPEQFQALDAGWYGAHDVELRSGVTATGVDRAARELTLDDGTTQAYDRLLIATGADPLHLPVPGADAAPLHYLRRLSDSTDLRAAISPGGRRVVIVGAGWIGLEVAAAARGYGNEVTVIEMGANPLERALGPEIGAFFARVHREQGVDLRTGVGVASFETAAGVTTVVDADGNRFEGDVVVVGAGIRPSVALAKDSGLEVKRGIIVDAGLRTADPHVWAAGDAAEAYHPYLKRHQHIEHWSFALNSGTAAGQSMLGQDITFDRVPYFFTDQYDVGMEFSGTTDTYDKVVTCGDLGGREFVAFWLDEGRVVAGMNVNVWDVVEPIQTLIRSGKAPDLALLTDPAKSMQDVLAAL